MALQPVIGIECHVQLDTRTKLFCSCPVIELNRPNQSICEVCTGHPGSLPALNTAAISLGIRAGLALGCQIQEFSAFDRKNYFYPDLPKGYQITQHHHPICQDGQVHAVVDGNLRAFALSRIHLEEDSGKLHHDGSSSRVDWNRAGRALVEIVSKPVLHSSEEAVAYMRSLHRTLVAARVTKGDLEKGHMRFDVNVSMNRADQDLGTRVEIKNLNSFRFAKKAIDQELERQEQVLSNGGRIASHTRGWSGSHCVPLRRKERADDYRYLPEPDLPVVWVSAEEIETEREALHPCPMDLHLIQCDQERVLSWTRRYGLRESEIQQIQSDAQVADFFEACVALGGSPQEMANWMQTELQRCLKLHAGQWALVALEPAHLVSIQERIDHGTISHTAAKTIFDILFEKGGDVDALIDTLGLQQIADEATLQQAIDQILVRFPQECQQYRNGQSKILGFLMGHLMRQTQGAANPRLLKRLLLEALVEHP